MDERDKLLRTIQELVGLFGMGHSWPFVDVIVDDDEHKHYPLAEDSAAVVARARKLLNDYGKLPIVCEPMGS